MYRILLTLAVAGLTTPAPWQSRQQCANPYLLKAVAAAAKADLKKRYKTYWFDQ